MPIEYKKQLEFYCLINYSFFCYFYLKNFKVYSILVIYTKDKL